jgi:hypothetical protein
MSLENPENKVFKISHKLILEGKYIYSSKKDAAEAVRVYLARGIFATILTEGGGYCVYTAKTKVPVKDFIVKEA